MKKVFLAAFLLALFIFLTDFCQKKTHGFTQGKIAPAFASRSSSQEFEDSLALLDQPFTYLKKGNSAFVLVSEDGKYVLKFLRKNHLNPPFWTQLFPSYFKHLIDEKTILRKELLASYERAEELKDQTGILYSHLFQTSHLKKNITFYDKIKVKHCLSADQTAFVLQKKADPFCPYFKSLSREDQQSLLKDFAHLLLERSQKGILDKDISPHYNLGIIDGKFVTFDLDSLRAYPLSSHQKEKEARMMLEAKKMLRFLKSVHLDLSLFLENEIKQLSHLS